jgi:5-methylcytosine-specific restriction protein A
MVGEVRRRLKAMPARLAGQPPKLKLPPKQADPFYQSKEWQAAKAAKRREGRRWCVRCGSTDRLILDHIIERKDGGPDFDPRNLQWLCHAHHQAKTATARGDRAKGQAR